jgi:hypothetical protein
VQLDGAVFGLRSVEEIEGGVAQLVRHGEDVIYSIHANDERLVTADGAAAPFGRHWLHRVLNVGLGGQGLASKSLRNDVITSGKIYKSYDMRDCYKIT